MNIAYLDKPNAREPAISLHLEAVEVDRRLLGRVYNIDDAKQLSDLLLRIYRCANMYALKLIAEFQTVQGEDKAIAARASRNASTNPQDVSSPRAYTMLQVQNIAIRYGRLEVLRDVSLQIDHGSVLGVVGANGSGKSSLLRVLAGVAPASAGVIAYPLLESLFPNSRSSRFDSIRYVTQEPRPWNGTVEQILRLHAALQGEQTDAQSDVAYNLARFGLQDYRGNNVRTLSAGYRVRFELARAALSKPKLLVLDEPLGPLDPPTRSGYLRAIRDLADNPRSKMAVVISSQDTISLDRIADDILVLTDGIAMSLKRENQESMTTTLFDLVIVYATDQSEVSSHDFSAMLRELGRFTVDFDRRPWRVESRELLAANSFLQAFLNKYPEIHVSYFRDVTRSAERFITGPRL